VAEVKELVYLETDKFNLTIKGQPVHPDWEQVDFVGQEQSARLEIAPINCKREHFSCLLPEEDKLQEVEGYEIKTVPLFYEWQDYEVIIEAKTGAEIEFYHQNKQLREAVTPLSGNPDILTGTLNFRTDVGFSELQIRESGVPLCTVKIEVFPSKIDYKNDYQQLLREVNQEVYNLAYDFLRRTFQQVSPRPAKEVTHSEFFTILDNIFTNFKQAFRRLEQVPHHRLEDKREIKPAGQVRKVNRHSLKWIKKNPRYYDQQSGRPVKCLDMESKISYNTFENKFIKWVITELKKRLADFREEYQAIYRTEADQEVLARIKEITGELDFLLKRTFLKEVGRLQKLNSLSLVLQLAPGYRELYKYFLMLKKGLSLSGELFNLSMKETWKLYEYWCFLKLNQILREEYNLLQTTLIDVDYSGIYVTLKQGKTARVEYEHPETGEEFALVYNSAARSGDSKAKSPAGKRVTTGQQPDNILTLTKEDSSINYLFVFDAKYRLNPAQPGSSYGNKYHGPGPEEETINTMHRYRDALLAKETGEYKRSVVGAYVLFPYSREEEFKQHKFYQSIDKVNVGAFPFLPGSIELVAQFLQELVEETALSNFERNVLPLGGEEYRDQLDFKQNVIVGSLGSRQQLEIMKEKQFYYLPAKRADLAGRSLDYVAIYQSKNKFPGKYGVNYYARIKDIQLKNRGDIPVPLSRNNSEEPYYFLTVDNWQKLAQPIVPEGYGIRGSHIYTNYMLLQKADTLPELSINSLAEWRVWLELKRIKRELTVEVDTSRLDQTTEVVILQGGEVKIEIIQNKIRLKTEEIEEVMELANFLRQPRELVNKIFS
jgi:predicted component of viral defense system (DUF524 family)